MQRVDARDRAVLVPNLLSFARVPLAGLLWIAPREPAWTLSVLFTAGLTDVLDGWLIRRARRRLFAQHDPGAYAATSAQGAFIDGMADKVFVLSAVLVLVVAADPPWWALVALAAREILFVPLMIGYRLAPSSLRARVSFTADVPGKAATIAQFVAIVLGLLHHPLFVEVALGAGALGAIAAAYYLARVLGAPAAPSGS